MKKYLPFLISLLFVSSVTFAQVSGGLTVPQGGTGFTSVGAGALIVGGSQLHLSATTSPTVGWITATSTTASSTLPLLSTTGLSASWLCLGGVCNSSWPSGGSGGGVGWATTTADNESIYFYGLNNVGIGTTTPGTILSVQGVGNFAPTTSTLYSSLTAPYFTATSTTATSTFSGGIESGTKIGAPYFFATSTTATSTFAGGLNLTGGGLSIGNLTGPLQAINGAVTSSSTLSAFYGGTGVNTLASNGILFGNGGGAIQATAAAANSILVTNGTNIPSLSTTLPAVTLGGAIAGNGQNITGLGTINGLAITANTGTITTGIWNGTAVDATHGGTNQTSWTKGDLLYSDNTNSLNKLGIGTGGYILGSANGAPAWVATTTFNSPLNYSNGAVSLGYGSSLTTSGTNLILNMANANTWTALQTFGNASTTQIGSTGSAYFATAGGNVGIGTAGPEYKLSINGAASTPALAIYTNAGVNEQYGALRFQYSVGNTGAGSEIRGVSPNSGTLGGDLAFATENNSGTYNENMRIQGSTGNVGIGTTTPWGRLSVTGADTLSTSEALAVADSNNSPLMVVQDGGNVGIGTNPNYASKVTIVDSSRAYTDAGSNLGALRIVAGADGLSNDALFIGVHTGDYSWLQAIANSVGYRNLSLNPNGGNVGIGTTSPVSLLTVTGAEGTSPYYAQIVLLPAGSNQDTAVSVGSNRNSTVQNWFFGSGSGNTPNNNNFRIVDLTAGNKDRLNIDTNGNVGIGTTVPQSALDVAGGVAIGSYAGVNAASSGNLIVSGNVGIGTKAPGAKLDIFATAPSGATTLMNHTVAQFTSDGAAHTGSIYGYKSEVGQNWGTGGTAYGFYGRPNVGDFQGLDNYYGLYLDQNVNNSGSSPGTSATITNNYGIYQADTTAKNYFGGNVGIGTTGPLSKLDISGGVAVGSYAGANAAPSNGLIVSGNVGIGTTTPSQKLDVNGSINIEGNNGIIMKDTATGGCYLLQMTSGVLVPSSHVCQ